MSISATNLQYIYIIVHVCLRSRFSRLAQARGRQQLLGLVYCRRLTSSAAGHVGGMHYFSLFSLANIINVIITISTFLSVFCIVGPTSGLSLID